MTPRRRAAVQAAIWSLYAGISLAMLRAYAPLSSAFVAIFVAVGAGLWAGTEALRALALRQGWLDLAPASLAWRLALWPVVVAVAIQAGVLVFGQAIVAAGLATLPPGTTRQGLGNWIGYVVNTTIMLWLWLGTWGGVQYLRRWKRGEVEKWQAEAARRALELEVLRAQVNPHFIFNALNNLRALISEDPAKARDAVTRLSSTLRHTLYHGARDLVPLAEELAIVRDYVALEQLHYEDRLRLRWDVAPGLDATPVPPMVLQLLVENAIKHGISRTPGGGEIEVVIGRDGDRVRMSVDNPGHWAPGPQAGLGLAHLRERLALAGGAGADCRIEEPAGRVRVVVRLGSGSAATAGTGAPAGAPARLRPEAA